MSVAMVDVDNSSLQVDWLGLRVGGRLALSYIRQLNRVNSRSYFVTMTATINIVRVLLLLFNYYPITLSQHAY